MSLGQGHELELGHVTQVKTSKHGRVQNYFVAQNYTKFHSTLEKMTLMNYEKLKSA